METVGQKDASLVRLETFTDAVFAVAMTILVLDLKPPEIGAAIRNNHFDYSFLTHHAPKFIAFFVSFSVLGNAWTGLLEMFRRAHHRTITMTWLTIPYLSFICLIPWAAAFWSENPFLPQAVALWMSLWVMVVGISTALHFHIVLTFCPEDPAARMSCNFGVGAFVSAIVFTLIAAFVTVYIGFIVIVVSTAMYAVRVARMHSQISAAAVVTAVRRVENPAAIPDA